MGDLYIYSNVSGLNKTLYPFYSSNNVQESITKYDNISTTCTHTRFYTDNQSSTQMLLSPGQTGQIKRLTYSKKGINKDAMVIVRLNALSEGSSPSIIFYNIGDTVLLFWDGGSWKILETLNTVDTSLQTPVININFVS